MFALSVLPLPNVQGKPVVSLQGEPLIEVEIAYDELTTDAINSKTETQTIRIQQTQDPAEVKLNAQAIPWVSLQRAAQAMIVVNEHMDAGRGDEALKALKEAIAALKGYGPTADVSEAVKMLELMAAKVVSGAWGARARKDSRYHSSALHRMSSDELWSSEAPAPSFKKSSPKNPPPEPPPGQQQP